MEVALVGAPGCGKSTLLAALTGRAPDAKGEGIGIAKVPDARVDQLSDIFRPRKTTYAELAVRDPLRTSEGGLERATPQALEALRGADVLAIVVPAFLDGADGGAASASAFTRLTEELILKDLMTLERRVERLTKERRPTAELELPRKAIEHLEAGSPLAAMPATPQEARELAQLRPLSLKPWIAAATISEAQIGCSLDAVLAGCGPVPLLLVPSLVELEVMALPAGERAAFFGVLGIAEPALDSFIRTAYRLCDLISFFTVGEDEVRAWTIRRGTAAPVAAGVIHSDIQRGYIRAEVVAYDAFVDAGSLAEARKRGALRLEGKGYTVADGDIINFRFNV